MTEPRAGWMRVGDIEIAPVWDGTLQAEINSILGLEPGETGRLIAAEAASTGTDPLTLPVRAFAIKDAGRVLLVDTGSGRTKGPSMGHLPNSLAALGIAPGAINAVLLTHLHMDHIGGMTDAEGLPAFPNAEVLLHEKEAHYFLDLPAGSVDARSRRHLDVQRAIAGAYGDRVRRVGDGGGIGGMTARAAPGHTPGHTVWEFTSNGQTAMVIGDVIHLGAVQLPRPHSAMIYDVDPDQAGRTRAALLAEVARRHILVAGAHLPGTGLGYVARTTVTEDGESYAFMAAEETRL